MSPNLHETMHFLAYAGEILNGKISFLCSVKKTAVHTAVSKHLGSFPKITGHSDGAKFGQNNIISNNHCLLLLKCHVVQ